MALKGTIKLSGDDISKDTLILKGDTTLLKLILTLVEPELIKSPTISGTKQLLDLLKKPNISQIEILLGDSKITKEFLLEVLPISKVQ